MLIQKYSALTIASLSSAALLIGCAGAGGSGNSAAVVGPLKPIVEPAKLPQNASNTDLPIFETSPGELKASVSNVTAKADIEIKKIGVRAPSEMTFENTIRAIDDLIEPVSDTAQRISVIQNTSPDAALRDEAAKQSTALSDYLTGINHRADLFAAVKKFREDNPNIKNRTDLSSEDFKFYDETWLGFKRSGMLLSSDEATAIQKIEEKLNDLSTQFEKKINDDQEYAYFPSEELAGVPDAIVKEFPAKDGLIRVNASVEMEYRAVSENAKSEKVRKKIEEARENLARATNTKVIAQLVDLRDQKARALGYASHADFQTELRMVKNAKTAKDFLLNLKEGLQPKFDKEIEALRKLKAEETGVKSPEFNLWDWRYYQNQLLKKKYTVDKEQLRVFFEFQRTIRGVFDVYEDIFGIRIAKIEAPYKWVPEVELYSVTDKANGNILGYFYLDSYPREGKYGHFAQFGITSGKMLANGTYVKPVVAIVCNFPKATADKPSLMHHEDVETFFHEFGHGMHSILTKAHYASYSGTAVEQDFVEAPSQTLEAWAWDMNVLNRFAEDYRNPSIKLEPALVARMKEAQLATMGAVYRRQLEFGLADLDLHMGGNKNTLSISQKYSKEVFLPLPEGADMMPGFGHMVGYDAGYYGYAWAKAISEDLLTEFKKAPGGLLDANVGMKLRREIYERGGSRYADESVRAFLGREWTIEPFLESLGIGKKTAATAPASQPTTAPSTSAPAFNRNRNSILIDP